MAEGFPYILGFDKLFILWTCNYLWKGANCDYNYLLIIISCALVESSAFILAILGLYSGCVPLLPLYLKPGPELG